ncbi:Omp28-related outer membrane protein [Bacteroidota bacterium]
MKKLFLFLIGVSIVIASCTKTSEKEDEQPDPTGPDPQPVQKALVLEQTGTWCGACPGAAAILHSLGGQYGKQIIPIAVHGGNNADPMEIDCFNSFRSDRMNSSFPSFFVPHERISSSESIVKNDIDVQLAWTPVKAGVDFIATKEGNIMNVELKVRFFQGAAETYYLSVYLLENGIDGGPGTGAYEQTSGGAGYTHEHVLRACASGANFWGDILNPSGAVAAGAEFDKTFNLTLDPSWNAANVYVVAVVWQMNQSGTPVAYLYVNGKDNRQVH